MSLRDLVHPHLKEEGTVRPAIKSEDSRCLSLQEMHMPRMRTGRRCTSQLRARLVMMRRRQQLTLKRQRATVPPWLGQSTQQHNSGREPQLKAEPSAQANTKHRGFLLANLRLLFTLHQRRQHTMDNDLIELKPKASLSDAPMLWQEYLLFREMNPSLAFILLCVSQLKHSRLKNDQNEAIGQIKAFRDDYDPLATRAMWTHIALWDDHHLGFPGPVRWTFKEFQNIHTYTKNFNLDQIKRISGIAKMLKSDATAALEELEAKGEDGNCGAMLVSETHGIPAYMTIWEAKVWARQAIHQGTELREACEQVQADREALYRHYIEAGIRVFRGSDFFDVAEFLGDFYLTSDNGDEVISL